MPSTQAQLEAKKKKAQAAQRQQFISIGVVVVTAALVFIILLFFIQSAGPQVARGKYDDLYKTTTAEGLPIIGDRNTTFLIREFSDFGCPYCLQYKPTIDQIIDKYVRPGQVRFIFSPQLFHPNSDVATVAAFCAEKQGKFWEMNDELFVVQSTQGTNGFEVNNLKNIAANLKLDTKAWLDCVSNSNQFKSAIDSAYSDFTKNQAGGTPTMMWSKDNGTTWNFFTNDQGQALNGGGVPIAVIAKTVDAYYQGKMS